MESLQARTRADQDAIHVLYSGGKESAAVDIAASKRSKLVRYEGLFERLKANSEVNIFTGCWEWQGYLTKGGYPKLTIRIDGRPRSVFAHRLILELMHGYYFPFDEAGHTCTNTRCVNPNHLEIQTRAFNMSEVQTFHAKNFVARMIPALFPIPGWQPHPAIVQLLAPQETEECPF